MNLIAWIFRRLEPNTIYLEQRIMSKIDDAVARLEASQAANTAAVTEQVNAAAIEVQQLADAISGASTDALADRVNAISDALDKDTADLTASTASLVADDPAPAVDVPAA